MVSILVRSLTLNIFIRIQLLATDSCMSLLKPLLSQPSTSTTKLDCDRIQRYTAGHSIVCRVLPERRRSFRRKPGGANDVVIRMVSYIGRRVVGKQTMIFTHDLLSSPENAPAPVGAVER